MSVFASPAAARRRARAALAAAAVLLAGACSAPMKKAGVAATLTVLPGAGHEDPAFMRTQWEPTLAFLDRVFHM